MGRRILIFTSKPRQMSFGGNDKFALQLTRHWPSPDDRLVFAFNRSHPCRGLFESALAGRAAIALLDEQPVVEQRLDRAAAAPRSKVARFVRELAEDLARPFAAAASIRRLVTFLRQQQPDVLFVNAGGNPPEDLALRLMMAARLRRVPRIILVNHNYPGRGTTRLRRAALVVLRRLSRFFCDTWAVPSRHMADRLQRSMADPRPQVVIPYGLDSEPLDAPSAESKRRELGLGNELVVGAVANLEERKGLHILVKAFPAILKEFPHTTLVLIGFAADPIYAEELRRLITELGLDAHVRNVGYKPEAGRFFECFDICVIPSIYSEGFGMVTLEALRYKKPIVAASTGGLREVLVDGLTGFFVPPGDSEALANAILKLLRSPELRAELGARSLERFNRYYRTEAMIDSYFKLAAGNL